MLRAKKFFSALLVSMTLVSALLGAPAGLLTSLFEMLVYSTLLRWFIAPVATT